MSDLQLEKIYNQIQYAMEDKNAAMKTMREAWSDLQEAERKLDAALERLAEYIGLDAHMVETDERGIVTKGLWTGRLDFIGDLF